MEQDIEESILHGILEQRIPLEEHDTESKTNSKDNEILSTHDSEKTTQPQITIKNDATSLFVLQLGPEDGSQSEDETQDFGAQSPQAATNNNSNNNDEKNDHSTSNNTSNNGINNENNLKDKDKSPNRRQDDKKRDDGECHHSQQPNSRDQRHAERPFDIRPIGSSLDDGNTAVASEQRRTAFSLFHREEFVYGELGDFGAEGRMGYAASQ